MTAPTPILSEGTIHHVRPYVSRMTGKVTPARPSTRNWSDDLAYAVDVERRFEAVDVALPDDIAAGIARARQLMADAEAYTGRNDHARRAAVVDALATGQADLAEAGDILDGLDPTKRTRETRDVRLTAKTAAGRAAADALRAMAAAETDIAGLLTDALADALTRPLDRDAETRFDEIVDLGVALRGRVLSSADGASRWEQIFDRPDDVWRWRHDHARGHRLVELAEIHHRQLAVEIVELIDPPEITLPIVAAAGWRCGIYTGHQVVDNMRRHWAGWVVAPFTRDEPTELRSAPDEDLDETTDNDQPSATG